MTQDEAAVGGHELERAAEGERPLVASHQLVACRRLLGPGIVRPARRLLDLAAERPLHRDAVRDPVRALVVRYELTAELQSRRDAVRHLICAGVVVCEVAQEGRVGERRRLRQRLPGGRRPPRPQRVLDELEA